MAIAMEWEKLQQAIIEHTSGFSDKHRLSLSVNKIEYDYPTKNVVVEFSPESGLQTMVISTIGDWDWESVLKSYIVILGNAFNAHFVVELSWP